MIHIEHAPFASGTVMTSLRFENVANKTIPPLLVFGVIQIEPPVHRHLPRVTKQSHEEAPPEQKVESSQNCRKDQKVHSSGIEGMRDCVGHELEVKGKEDENDSQDVRSADDSEERAFSEHFEGIVKGLFVRELYNCKGNS